MYLLFISVFIYCFIDVVFISCSWQQVREAVDEAGTADVSHRPGGGGGRSAPTVSANHGLGHH